MKILNPGNLDFACKILKNGELLAFPTETVYGLGGNAYSDDAVVKIFQCKKRSQFNPISVCYSSFHNSLSDIETTKEAELLAENFLPGALTLVLRRRNDSRISWLCSAGKDTIGIRIPKNSIALNLLKDLDFPLAAPSANMSSGLSSTTALDVCKSLNTEDLYVLDGGICDLGIESTIVDLSEDQPKILRIGAISKEEIEDKCKVKFVIDTKSKFSHYKPKKAILLNVQHVEENDALLAFGTPISKTKYYLNLSENSDLNEAAKNLFSMLHSLDSSDAKRICVMHIPNIGIGQAINDRLAKASN